MLWSIVAVAGLGSPLALAGSPCQQAIDSPQRTPLVITFEADSADLSRGDRGRLHDLVRGDEVARAARVCVVGQADAQGDARYHRELAQRRAEAVARVMTEAGLDDRRLVLEVRPIGAGNSAFLPDRRVEILTLSGGETD